MTKPDEMVLALDAAHVRTTLREHYHAKLIAQDHTLTDLPELIADEDLAKGIAQCVHEMVGTKEAFQFAMLPRSKAEEMPQYRQPIGYTLVVRDGKVLVARRTKKGGEGKLHERVHVGFGGHCNRSPSQLAPESPPNAHWGLVRTLRLEAEREMEEELGLLVHHDFLWANHSMPLALIHSSFNEVSTVHLAVVMVAVLRSGAEINQGDGHSVDMEFCNADQLRMRLPSMERWSQLITEDILADGQIGKAVQGGI